MYNKNRDCILTVNSLEPSDPQEINDKRTAIPDRAQMGTIYHKNIFSAILAITNINIASTSINQDQTKKSPGPNRDQTQIRPDPNHD